MRQRDRRRRARSDRPGQGPPGRVTALCGRWTLSQRATRHGPQRNARRHPIVDDATGPNLVVKLQLSEVPRPHVDGALDPEVGNVDVTGLAPERVARVRTASRAWLRPCRTGKASTSRDGIARGGVRASPSPRWSAWPRRMRSARSGSAGGKHCGKCERSAVRRPDLDAMPLRVTNELGWRIEPHGLGVQDRGQEHVGMMGRPHGPPS